MYIPKIRKSEQVVAYFRERDKNSVMTKALLNNLADDGMISKVCVGRNQFFNLDEVIAVLSCSNNLGATYPLERVPPYDIENITEKRHLLHPHELVEFIKKYDKDSPINKYTFRTIAQKGLVIVTTIYSHYLLDLTEVLQYFSGNVKEPASKSVPRLRNYEKCYHSVRKWIGNKISWNKYHSIVDDNQNFAYWSRNRWIVDYDKVKAYFNANSPVKIKKV